jgi:hypothetical protein
MRPDHGEDLATTWGEPVMVITKSEMFDLKMDQRPVEDAIREGGTYVEAVLMQVTPRGKGYHVHEVADMLMEHTDQKYIYASWVASDNGTPTKYVAVHPLADTQTIQDTVGWIQSRQPKEEVQKRVIPLFRGTTLIRSKLEINPDTQNQKLKAQTTGTERRDVLP